MKDRDGCSKSGGACAGFLDLVNKFSDVEDGEHGGERAGCKEQQSQVPARGEGSQSECSDGSDDHECGRFEVHAEHRLAGRFCVAGLFAGGLLGVRGALASRLSGESCVLGLAGSVVVSL